MSHKNQSVGGGMALTRYKQISRAGQGHQPVDGGSAPETE